MCRFLRNPTELKSIKNISLLRQQPPPPQPASHVNSTQSNKLGDNQLNHGTSNSLNSNTQQQLSHLPTVMQQQHQQPPPSPRVHALNGAFHYLSTSSVPERISPHSNSSQRNQSNASPEFKVEPSIDIDDMPTDLSTNGDRKYNNGNSNTDCYP